MASRPTFKSNPTFEEISKALDFAFGVVEKPVSRSTVSRNNLSSGNTGILAPEPSAASLEMDSGESSVLSRQAPSTRRMNVTVVSSYSFQISDEGSDEDPLAFRSPTASVPSTSSPSQYSGSRRASVSASLSSSPMGSIQSSRRASLPASIHSSASSPVTSAAPTPTSHSRRANIDHSDLTCAQGRCVRRRPAAGICSRPMRNKTTIPVFELPGKATANKFQKPVFADLLPASSGGRMKM